MSEWMSEPPGYKEWMNEWVNLRATKNKLMNDEWVNLRATKNEWMNDEWVNLRATKNEWMNDEWVNLILYFFTTGSHRVNLRMFRYAPPQFESVHPYSSATTH